MDSCRLFRGSCYLLAAVLASGISTVALCQSSGAPGPQKKAPAASTPANMDDQVVTAPSHPQSKAELTATAWKMLEDALADEKHPDTKTQALAALGTMGSNARVGKMITGAFADQDLDVRTAAVLVAGQTKNRTLIPALRTMLDDKESQVAFAAACTLWKMGDHSGEDLLQAVVDGDRPGNSGMMHGSMHAANKELHNPAALAKLGAIEGAAVLLGPFGFGISAYEYMKHNGGGNAPRVAAIEELAELKTPAIRKELLDTVTDKDPAVRAAAAKALRSYHDAEVNQALAMLFQDSKKPVQLVGASAYLISVGAVALPAAQPATN
jgi:HEAT repeat protein